MVCVKVTQDSNTVGLNYIEEECIGTLPGSPVAIELEPNSYADFGAPNTLLARNPINASRQQSKGVVVDRDASASFNMDWTQQNYQDLLQGVFFADFRDKFDQDVTDVDQDSLGWGYNVADNGDEYLENDLLFAKGMDNDENNGLKTVAAGSLNNRVPVAETLVNETPTIPVGTNISRVGHIFGSGELEIDASGSLPIINRASGSYDFTTWNLVPGEWIFVGGDGAGEKFATASDVNNGWKRVKSVTATQITIDKSASTMVTEAAGSLTIHIYFGRSLKNESGSLIKRRSYQLERTLNAPDDSLPAEIQSEYIVGCVPNEFSFTLGTADKLNADLTFLGTARETRTGAVGVKSATRLSADYQGGLDAFSASTNAIRVNMAVYETGNEAPTPLFSHVTDMSLTINNNLTAAKAIGTIGAIDITAGQFIVSGSANVYFLDVAALSAIDDNSDVTFDIHFEKANQGMSIDLPLVALGNGVVQVEQDAPILVPLDIQAARGRTIDSNMDHSILVTFFDWLPNLASTL